MPMIQVNCPRTDKEKKRELVRKLTETASEILGIPEPAFTVVIYENDPDNGGVGGKLLSEGIK